MGKIVKFCSSCDEGFAEKFGFCPNCGSSLQTFEMKPVVAEAPPSIEREVPPMPEIIAAPVAAEFNEPVTPPEIAVETAAPTPEAIEEIEEPVVEPVETKTVAAAAPVYVRTTPVDVDRKPVSLEAEHDKYVENGGFYVTVIEEKNVRQRNLLFLGSAILIVTLAVGATIISLFLKTLDVYAIGDDNLLASLIDNVPMTVEEEKQQKEKKDAGGGGGGGGNNDPNPASQGDRAPMRINPELAPSVTMDRLTNPTIPIQMAIKGPINEYKLNLDRYGVKLGADQASDGPGSNLGQGGGRNGGQGNNTGPGGGLGNNGGIGGPGNGGIGPGGDGPGGQPPPPAHVGVTQGIKILSKPRPGYTDAARQNNIQGTVILRVTFLASGQVGGISAVKGLGNGLTEQAIAAARRISFEPAKVNGVSQNVTKQIEYTFSIY